MEAADEDTGVLRVALVEVEGSMGSVPRSIRRPPPEAVPVVEDDGEGEPEYLALVLAAASAEGKREGETSSSAAELEDLEGVRSRYCCCSILSYLFMRRLLLANRR